MAAKVNEIGDAGRAQLFGRIGIARDKNRRFAFGGAEPGQKFGGKGGIFGVGTAKDDEVGRGGSDFIGI